MNVDIFILLYGPLHSISSLMFSVYLHFTPEIDTPFVQLD